jgi:hypothetical protein
MKSPLALSLTAALAFSLSSHAAAQFLSDPAYTTVTTPTTVILVKELTGYPNYGAPDNAADILYTGNSGTWNFALPLSVNLTDIQNPFYRVTMAADDHYGVASSLYSFSAATNGTVVYNGTAGLPHGSPFNSAFSNWVQRDFLTTLTAAPVSNILNLVNTSNTGVTDWIAVDRIELHLPLRSVNSVAPEPGTMSLTFPFIVSLLLRGVRRRSQN